VQAKKPKQSADLAVCLGFSILVGFTKETALVREDKKNPNTSIAYKLPLDLSQDRHYRLFFEYVLQMVSFH
jgi:hypothetical protein